MLDESLVHATASDGLQLAGALITERGRGDGACVVWIHGGASSFHARPTVNIARALAEAGVAVLIVNTRGHDLAALDPTSDDVVVTGSAYERFDEVAHDLEAWLRLARELGHRELVLAGHSLGAAKVVCYAAGAPSAGLRAVVLASPAPPMPVPPERLALAETMLEEGRGAELLPLREGAPAWSAMSAQTLATRERCLAGAFRSPGGSQPDITRLPCPALVVYGEADEEVTEEWPSSLRASASPAGLDLRGLAGAGHDFAGFELQVAGEIVGWLPIERRLVT